MKAKSPAILVTLALGCGVALAHASTNASEATAHVSVRIAPSIAVSEPRAVIIDLRDHQVDSPIRTQVQFLVRANTQEVELQVACTDLYKAGDPASAYKIPVAGIGAEIGREHGDKMAGGSRLLQWQPAPPTGLLPAGWTGAVTEVGAFTTSAATFTENVTVGVSWHITDSALPTGEYIGFVELIGMVRP
jgi:hypothetical protein